MEQSQYQVVNVSVATIWTSPESPTEKDRPAIQHPVDVNKWLGELTVEDRLKFHDNNCIQTQVLYGTVVEVIERQGDWCQIVIPDQPSRKDQRGYPGWMPARQLHPLPPSYRADDQQPIAMVMKPTAKLYDQEGKERMELSFVTRLPALDESSQWVKVLLPNGESGMLRRDDTQVFVGSPQPPQDGRTLLETGKMFLGLPYLWGGTSAYGYDCSGFTYSMHRAYGLSLGRDATEQAQAGELIPLTEMQPGDLIFFAYEEGKGAIHHVGFYYGEGQLLHAPNTGKSVEIVPLKGFSYERELCVCRRYW